MMFNSAVTPLPRYAVNVNGDIRWEGDIVAPGSVFTLRCAACDELLLNVGGLTRREMCTGGVDIRCSVNGTAVALIFIAAGGGFVYTDFDGVSRYLIDLAYAMYRGDSQLMLMCSANSPINRRLYTSCQYHV